MKTQCLFGLFLLIEIRLFFSLNKNFLQKVLTIRIEFGIIENVKSGAYTRCLSKRDNNVRTKATNTQINRGYEDNRHIPLPFLMSEDHT